MLKVLVMAGVVALSAGTSPAQKDKEPLRPGDQLKELKLKTLDGKEITLQSLKKGTILVINFWGSS